jgi:hypothetical protein
LLGRSISGPSQNAIGGRNRDIISVPQQTLDLAKARLSISGLKRQSGGGLLIEPALFVLTVPY